VNTEVVPISSRERDATGWQKTRQVRDHADIRRRRVIVGDWYRVGGATVMIAIPSSLKRLSDRDDAIHATVAVSISALKLRSLFALKRAFISRPSALKNPTLILNTRLYL